MDSRLSTEAAPAATDGDLAGRLGVAGAFPVDDDSPRADADELELPSGCEELAFGAGAGVAGIFDPG